MALILLWSDLHAHNPNFWKRVDFVGDCWIWSGWLARGGYGGAWNPLQKRNEGAHRVAWQLAFGAIPNGLFVCHTCDNKLCVRPNHLWLGTHQDNMRDMSAKGRQVFQKQPERAPRGNRNGHVTHPESNVKGEHVWNAKLSYNDVIEILKILKTGLSSRTIAKQFNVTYGLIQHIKKGRAWKHVSRI